MPPANEVRFSLFLSGVTSFSCLTALLRAFSTILSTRGWRGQPLVLFLFFPQMRDLDIFVIWGRGISGEWDMHKRGETWQRALGKTGRRKEVPSFQRREETKKKNTAKFGIRRAPEGLPSQRSHAGLAGKGRWERAAVHRGRPAGGRTARWGDRPGLVRLLTLRCCAECLLGLWVLSHCASSLVSWGHSWKLK